MRTVTLTLLALVGCSLMVDDDIDDVRCATEGTIGPPACDVGEICAEGRCHDCLATDVCGDEVDNDCSGSADDDCSEGGASGGS